MIFPRRLKSALIFRALLCLLAFSMMWYVHQGLTGLALTQPVQRPELGLGLNYLDKRIVKTGRTTFLKTSVTFTCSDWKSPGGTNQYVQEMIKYTDFPKPMRVAKHNTKHVYHAEGLPEKCATKDYGDLSLLPKTSIHITFHENENLLNIAHMMHSIFLNTPHQLIQEIILVDDNSTKEELKELLENYVFAVFGHHGITLRVVRSNTKLGAIRARILAARLAEAEVLVIMDSHMEFRHGWLEPLLYEIKLNRKTMATSCLDWMKPQEDGSWVYEHGGNSFRGIFDWDMTFKYFTRPVPPDHDPTEPLLVPLQLGGALAIDRKFFFEIEGFDEGMEAWGGENIDLSLRVFLCGGRVIQVPCSHVAHLEVPKMRDYRYVGDPSWTKLYHHNNNRVVQSLFGPYKKYYYLLNPGAQEIDAGDVSGRIRSIERCSGNFSWYLANFYPEMGNPMVDALAYGKVKNNKTGMCIDAVSMNTEEVFPCHNSGAPQVFLWTSQGYIRTGTIILDVSGSPTPKAMFRQSSLILDPNFEATRFIHWKDGLIMVEKTGKCFEVSNSSLISNADCDPTNQAQLWTVDTYTDNYHTFLRGEHIEESSLSSPEAGRRFYEKVLAILQKYKV